MESAFGSYVLDWNEDFNWSFIPWPFAMWSPYGSRVCSFSIVPKDWQFFLEFHLGLVAVFSFFSRVGIGHVLLCSIFRHPSVGCITCRMFFPSSFRSFCFLLCGFSYQSGLFSLLLPYLGVNPLASIVTLVYSFQLTQTASSCECVDMCGLREVLFNTLLYALTD